MLRSTGIGRSCPFDGCHDVRTNGSLAKDRKQPIMANPVIDGPHFIGIGAPRCGTTWTFKMLRLHPDVWIPWKELHFFDSVDPDTDSGYVIQSRSFRFARGWSYVARRLAVRSIPGATPLMRRYFPLRAIHAPGYRWAFRYLFGTVSLTWYADLFREGRKAGFRCGEITPAYCMLSASAIRQFASVMPDVRVFLLLRHPLDWAWSDICKELRKTGMAPGQLSDTELIARCPVPTGRSRADFGSNLQRWMDNFPRDRLLIGFHDEIENEPRAFFERLCAFLGLRPPPSALAAQLRARVNSSARGLPMPAAVKQYAAARFVGEASKMASLAGGPAERWLKDIEAAVDRSSTAVSSSKARHAD